jgi:hypothetical protein
MNKFLLILLVLTFAACIQFKEETIQALKTQVKELNDKLQNNNDELWDTLLNLLLGAGEAAAVAFCDTYGLGWACQAAIQAIKALFGL